MPTPHELRTRASAVVHRARQLIQLRCIATMHVIGRSSVIIAVESPADRFALELRIIESGTNTCLSLQRTRGAVSRACATLLSEFDGLVTAGWR